MPIEAFFLAVSPGQRFCLFHPHAPSVEARGAVVYVHPFAEEMNKSRRMAALQARAMADSGYSVLQVDLLGCGDSSGDFGDATWEGWVDDVKRACDWLQERTGLPLWLWGLRTGCLLAGEAARQTGRDKLLFWNPVLSGKQFLQQFLRLKIAGEMMSGESKGLMNRLRDQLADGQSVEIAGYRLSAAVAAGLERAELMPPAGAGRVEWIELSASPDAAMSPAADARLRAWQSSGHRARGTSVPGPAFWQTAEISECAALLDASVQAMADRAPA